MFYKIGFVVCVCAYMTQADKNCTMPTNTTYDCSNQNLTKIPDEIAPDATSIDLSDNWFANLTDGEFSKFTVLQTLLLDNNKIVNVSGQPFSGCIKMKALSIAQNNISNLPPKVFDSIPLENLTLAQNLFPAIPETAFADLTTLTNLDLTSLNRINDLDNISHLILGDVFQTLPLKTLAIAGLGFRNITKEVFVNVNDTLSNLDLSNNKLDNPGSGAFEKFTDLMSLNLDQNIIKTIGMDAFKGSGNLVQLDVSYNRLNEIPSLLCTHLTKLQRMNMNGFKGTALKSDAFSQCTNLENVSVTFSSITDIGTAFANLTNLTSLDLSNNPNLRITNDNAFKNTTALTTLDLHGMGTTLGSGFYQLPHAIHDLTKLQELDVSYGRFSAFSKEDTTKFDTLKHLYATHNPYDCACRHIDFIVWFQHPAAVIPKEERNDYNCLSCDQCDSVPLPLSNYNISICNSSPNDNHEKVLKYGIGLAFAGLVVGILCTSCVVYLLVKKRSACFKTPYVDLDRTANA